MLQLTLLRCVPSFKSLAQVWAKHKISSQTIKYRYKFKSNPNVFLQKMLELTIPRCVASFKSLAQGKVKKQEEEEDISKAVVLFASVI